jgi:hypothetical protein
MLIASAAQGLVPSPGVSAGVPVGADGAAQQSIVQPTRATSAPEAFRVSATNDARSSQIGRVAFVGGAKCACRRRVDPSGSPRRIADESCT